MGVLTNFFLGLEAHFNFFSDAFFRPEKCRLKFCRLLRKSISVPLFPKFTAESIFLYSFTANVSSILTNYEKGAIILTVSPLEILLDAIDDG